MRYLKVVASTKCWLDLQLLNSVLVTVASVYSSYSLSSILVRQGPAGVILAGWIFASDKNRPFRNSAGNWGEFQILTNR